MSKLPNKCRKWWSCFPEKVTTIRKNNVKCSYKTVYVSVYIVCVYVFVYVIACAVCVCLWYMRVCVVYVHALCVHQGQRLREDRGRFFHHSLGDCVGVIHSYNEGNMICFVFEETCQYLVGPLKWIVTWKMRLFIIIDFYCTSLFPFLHTCHSHRNKHKAATQMTQFW